MRIYHRFRLSIHRDRFIHRHWLTILLLILLAVLCILVMLPRLRQPAFDLLDDGINLQNGAQVWKSPQLALQDLRSSGRIVPSYWWRNALLFRFAGNDPFNWFLYNTLLFIFITLALFLLARQRGVSRGQAFLIGLLFCLSPPVAESFYTLGKPEPLLLALILAGILIILVPGGLTVPSNDWRNRPWLRPLAYVAAGLCFWLAFAAKEPALALIPASLAWWLSARFLPDHDGDRLTRCASRDLFFTATVAGLVFLVVYLFAVGIKPPPGSYASLYRFDLARLWEQALRWLGYLLRDDLFLVPLALLLFFPAIRQRVNIRWLVDSMAWMIAWFFMLLPWAWLNAYFLLPFTAGVAMLGGALLGAGLSALFEPGKAVSEKQARQGITGQSNSLPYSEDEVLKPARLSVQQRIWTGICLLAALFLLQFNLVNLISSGKAQIAYDTTNQKLVRALSRLDPGSQIVLNFGASEYYYEIQAHLAARYNRDDLSIRYMNYPLPPGDQPLDLYVVTPLAENLLVPGVRSGFSEADANQWQRCLATTTSSEIQPYKVILAKQGWVDLGLNRALSRLGVTDLLSANIPPGSGRSLQVVNSQTMTYGWQIDHLTLDPANLAHPGLFDPASGWIFQIPSGVHTVATPLITDGVPLSGDFNGDGSGDLAYNSAQGNLFVIDLDRDGQANMEFTLSSMQTDDIPLAGDWDGDGVDTPGYYRPSDQTWHIRNRNESGKSDFTTRLRIGIEQSLLANAIPLSGDWNGDGFDTFGVYVPQTGEVWLADSIQPGVELAYAYRGPAGATPVSSDWYGFDRDTLAFYKDGEWLIRPNSTDCAFPFPIQTFRFGEPTDLPFSIVP